MEIGLIIKIAGIGMVVAVLAQIFNKSGRDEQAMLVTVAGIVVGLALLLGEIGGLIDTLRSSFGI